MPSKSVKKMNFGFVFMAGRVEEDILERISDGESVVFSSQLCYRGLRKAKREEKYACHLWRF